MLMLPSPRELCDYYYMYMFGPPATTAPRPLGLAILNKEINLRFYEGEREEAKGKRPATYVAVDVGEHYVLCVLGPPLDHREGARLGLVLQEEAAWRKGLVATRLRRLGARHRVGTG